MTEVKHYKLDVYESNKSGEFETYVDMKESESSRFTYVKSSDYDALRVRLEEHNKFFREILFTEEGNKIVGVSRNGAIKAYNRNIYVARKLLYGQPYPENIHEE